MINKKTAALSAAAFMLLALAVNEIFFSPEKLTIAGFQEYKRAQEEEREKENARPGYPGRLLQWYYSQRSVATGSIPAGWRAAALKEISVNNLALEKSAGALSWTNLGPGNVGGRIRSIAVDPLNSSVIYVGSVSGGIWKTSNGGAQWFPLKDDMENLSISSLVIDPADNKIIYAGTGEGFFNYDALRGEGIFKSTDAGATWNRLASTLSNNFYYVNRLTIDKTTNILWAATRNGLFKSSDGGNTFSAILSGTNVHCTDVKIAYTSPKSTVLASFGLFNRFAIFKSSDAGTTFVNKYNAYDYKNRALYRTEMAVSSKNPLYAYISSMDSASSKIGAMNYTTDAGETWQPMTVPGGTDTYASGQAWYNNVLAVDPDNENVVFAGGIEIYRTTNRGNSWTQFTSWVRGSSYPYVHADHHALVFDPKNSSILYSGNDGGIYKSTNKGLSWASLNNNLSITQFYYGAVDPKADIWYGGSQDNGTLKSSGGSAWTEILGGDGGPVEIDYKNPGVIYMSYVNMAIFKSSDGGASYTKVMSGIPAGTNTYDGTTDRAEFIAPLTMDPNNPAVLYAGSYKLYRTQNGAGSWTAVSGDLTTEGTGPSGANISAITVAPGNSGVIYVGSSNGVLQVTTDNGATWNQRNSGLPFSYTRKIAVSAQDPAVAFVVYSGFSSGKKVYKTTDYGASWTNISGSLPNIPVNCILVNPGNINNLLAGTDLGIFSTADGGKNWNQDNSGLANVSVSDLDYRSSDNTIFAATHGRGMFSAVWNNVSSADAPASSPLSYQLSQNYPNPFNPSTVIKYRIPSEQNVRITVFDSNGRKVKELINAVQQAGNHSISWDGSSDAGSASASGVYIYSIQAGSFSRSLKMTLIR